MTYAMYLKETQGISIEQQSKEIIEAYRFDAEITVYEETTHTNKSTLNLLLKNIKEKRHEGVIVYNLKSLGMTLKEIINLLKDLRSFNAEFICFKNSLDSRAEWWSWAFDFMNELTSIQQEISSQRTKEGIEKRRKKGEPIGRPVGKTDIIPRKKEGYSKANRMAKLRAQILAEQQNTKNQTVTQETQNTVTSRDNQNHDPTE